jgi:ketopantoate reductase
MLKPSEAQNVFKPSFQLDERSLGIITASVRQEWWDIMQRLMEEELRIMTVKLLNSDDEKTVVEAHRMVKYASMFYSGVMDRIAELTAIDAYNQSGVGRADKPEVPLYPEEFATPEQI